MDASEIEERFAGLGPVRTKRLFGGLGVYYQGLIVGAVMDGELLLKADAVSAPDFAAAGAKQWVYTYKSGKKSPMPYWSVPVDAFDDPDLLARWVRLAFAAARRSAATVTEKASAKARARPSSA